MGDQPTTLETTGINWAFILFLILILLVFGFGD
jgi:hypothetical protein